jgi:FeS assembly SUF system protein
MTQFKPVADEDMVRDAVGDEFDEMAEPPCIQMPDGHVLAPKIRAALRNIFDPEIPVNIYELGLIYAVDISPAPEDKVDVAVTMTLTSPACPVAQDMPGWVQGAIFGIDGVRHVDVSIIWDPPWDPSKMAETAKLQLNMFV